MKNFILTGAPGSGKTAILRQFELGGFGGVKEAATDIIALDQAQGGAEPCKQPSFIDAIVALQKQRLSQTLSAPEEIQFHDRSVFCTAALATYLGYPFPKSLEQELKRVLSKNFFQKMSFLFVISAS